MVKGRMALFNKLSKLADLTTVSLAFVVSHCLCFGWRGFAHFTGHLWIMLIVLPSWSFLLGMFDLHTSQRTVAIQRIIVALFKVHVFGALILSSTVYFIYSNNVSRLFIIYFIAFSFLLLALERITQKVAIGNMRRRGFNYRNIVIVGTEEKAFEFTRVIECNPDWGFRIVGFVQETDNVVLKMFSNYNVLGDIRQLVDLCISHHVDEVIFCLPRKSMIEVDDIIHGIEEMGITIRMILDLYESRRSRRELSFFNDQLPILTFYSKPFDAGKLFVKRCLDITGATVGLFLTAFLLPFIAIAVKLDSKGPLFFGQKRVGENGRAFTCWKIRSMYIDAEDRKKDLMSQNEMAGPMFKIKDDPRVTKVGRFLRKTSLDEIPQFWNVLIGEMSLVGTRPPTPDEVSRYENWQRKRICIKPGITGFWQVSGRSSVQLFDDVVKLDLEYIEKWSLWLDFTILAKTFLVVFMRNGSC